MRKFLLSLVFIVTFSLYVFFERRSDTTLTQITPTPTVATIQKNEGGTVYKDGSYIGPVTDAYYGDIQVKAIIKNGVLADVTFLKYPDDRPTSIEINQEAMPVLKKEAITAQNARVDIVSGATDSSKAFSISLGNALSQAAL